MPKKEAKKEAPVVETVPCVNCNIPLPKHTGVCPNCSYRQPHPGWS